MIFKVNFRNWNIVAFSTQQNIRYKNNRIAKMNKSMKQIYSDPEEENYLLYRDVSFNWTIHLVERFELVHL